MISVPQDIDTIRSNSPSKSHETVPFKALAVFIRVNIFIVRMTSGIKLQKAVQQVRDAYVLNNALLNRTAFDEANTRCDVTKHSSDFMQVNHQIFIQNTCLSTGIYNS
jgi:hypothetical protein